MESWVQERRGLRITKGRQAAVPYRAPREGPFNTRPSPFVQALHVRARYLFDARRCFSHSSARPTYLRHTHPRGAHIVLFATDCLHAISDTQYPPLHTHIYMCTLLIHIYFITRPTRVHFTCFQHNSHTQLMYIMSND